MEYDTASKNVVDLHVLAWNSVHEWKEIIVGEDWMISLVK